MMLKYKALLMRLEHRQATGMSVQDVQDFLAGHILVGGRHAGIAENVAGAGRPDRLFNVQFGDAPAVLHSTSVQGPQVVSL